MTYYTTCKNGIGYLKYNLYFDDIKCKHTNIFQNYQLTNIKFEYFKHGINLTLLIIYRNMCVPYNIHILIITYFESWMINKSHKHVDLLASGFSNILFH